MSIHDENAYSFDTPNHSNENLNVQQPQFAVERYYIVTDVTNSDAYHVTHISSQCGDYQLTEEEAMSLYEGKLIKRAENSVDKNSENFIVRAGFDRKKGATNCKDFGAYQLHVATLRPYCDPTTGTVLGYICNNIYFPKKITSSGLDRESWNIDATRAAGLACFGEIEDEYGRWMGIEDFEAIKIQAARSPSPVAAPCDFLDHPRNNWHAHNTIHHKCQKNSKHRSIVEYVKQELPHSLAHNILNQSMTIDRVLASGKEYYQIWSASPDSWGYVVNIPVKIGACELTQKHALELYEQRSTIVKEKKGEKNNWHYVVPFGIVDELKISDYQKVLLEGQIAKLREVYPVHNRSSKEIIGYKCNNIYIPKVIKSTGGVWEVNETKAAQLCSFGEMWDWNHLPVLKVANFPKVCECAVVSDRPVEVGFIVCNHSKQHQKKSNHSRRM